MFNKFKYYIYKLMINYLSDWIIKDRTDIISKLRFKNLSDFTFNNNLYEYPNGSILFIESKDLKNFLNNYVNTFQNNVAAICFNDSDEKFCENELSLLPNNISLFISNLDINFRKYKNIYPLPTGVYDKKNLFLRRGIEKVIRDNSKFYKGFNILCNVNLTTNEERENMVESIFNIENIKYQNFLNHREYLKNMTTYNFVLCPSGKLIDTHRFWEVIACKAIPIVKKNHIYSYFKDIGVPMIILNDWNELRDLKEEELKSVLIKYSNTEFTEYLKIDFWKNFIKKEISL